MSARYSIRTVADFLAIPSEKIGDCLVDFIGWLAVMKTAMDMPAGTRLPESFDWIDDGKHIATVTISDGATGQVISKASMDIAVLLDEAD